MVVEIFIVSKILIVDEMWEGMVSGMIPTFCLRLVMYDPSFWWVLEFLYLQLRNFDLWIIFQIFIYDLTKFLKFLISTKIWASLSVKEAEQSQVIGDIGWS